MVINLQPDPALSSSQYLAGIQHPGNARQGQAVMRGPGPPLQTLVKSVHEGLASLFMCEAFLQPSLAFAWLAMQLVAGFPFIPTNGAPTQHIIPPMPLSFTVGVRFTLFKYKKAQKRAGAGEML